MAIATLPTTVAVRIQLQVNNSSHLTYRCKATLWFHSIVHSDIKLEYILTDYSQADDPTEMYWGTYDLQSKLNDGSKSDTSA